MEKVGIRENNMNFVRPLRDKSKFGMDVAAQLQANLKTLFSPPSPCCLRQTRTIFSTTKNPVVPLATHVVEQQCVHVDWATKLRTLLKQIMKLENIRSRRCVADPMYNHVFELRQFGWSRCGTVIFTSDLRVQDYAETLRVQCDASAAWLAVDYHLARAEVAIQGNFRADNETMWQSPRWELH